MQHGMREISRAFHIAPAAVHYSGETSNQQFTIGFAEAVNFIVKIRYLPA
jgi:hypothetical protein